MEEGEGECDAGVPHRVTSPGALGEPHTPQTPTGMTSSLPNYKNDLCEVWLSTFFALYKYNYYGTYIKKQQ